jgi:hypothetical protein
MDATIGSKERGPEPASAEWRAALVAAGWLAAGAGTSEEDASAYAEGIRRGGTLVSARVPDTDRARYEAILDRSSVNIRNRGAAWRNDALFTNARDALPTSATDGIVISISWVCRG